MRALIYQDISSGNTIWAIHGKLLEYVKLMIRPAAKRQDLTLGKYKQNRAIFWPTEAMAFFLGMIYKMQDWTRSQRFFIKPAKPASVAKVL